MEEGSSASVVIEVNNKNLRAKYQEIYIQHIIELQTLSRGVMVEKTEDYNKFGSRIPDAKNPTDLCIR